MKTVSCKSENTWKWKITILGDTYQKMGFKTMKMEWDICSSPSWVPFYPFTLFQNPISRPSHTKCKKNIITQKVLVTQSSNIVHCDWHMQKPICADLQAFANTFSLCKLTFFSVFCQGEFRKQPKVHILLIWTGENALKWLEWHIFRVWGMLSPMPQGLSLCNKRFLKNHNFRKKFHILLILTGKNALKLLEWHIFRVRAVLNPVALVASLYNKQFMKNHNFRRHIAENGVQNHENGMKHMQQSFLGPILPLHHVSEPYILTFHKKCRKTIITQNLLVTQSSNIVHCDLHTQKLVCADLQAFANTFSLYKLTFFSFLSGEVQETAKISCFVDLDWENALKWLEWHIFRVWGMRNPMPQVVSLCDKWFLQNHNFRQKFHILLIMTGKNALKLLECAYLVFEACQIQCHL